MDKGKLIDEIFGEKCEGSYIQVYSVSDFLPDTKIDVLIQEEVLGKRVLLQDLDRVFNLIEIIHQRRWRTGSDSVLAGRRTRI